MQSHNLLLLLKKFSVEELKSLRTFLDSPYHNKSKKVIRLFSEIEKFYPEFDADKLTKEYLGKKINPGKKYVDSSIRDLISDLLKLTEEFLINEEFRNKLDDKGKLLLKALLDKNENELFEKNMKLISEEFESRGIDSVYYYNKGILHILNINHDMINHYQKTSKNIEYYNRIIFSYMVSLFLYFITELISSYFKLIINESKFKLFKESNTALVILESIDFKKISTVFKDSSKEKVVFEIYFNLFYAFKNLEDISFYTKYKSLIFNNSKILSRDEISFHFSMLITYCILKNSFGKDTQDYDPELFNVYNTFLRGKYFIDKKTKFIDEDLYRNILMLSLRMKKFRWALNLVKSFQNLINLSYAEYYYFYGVYNKSFVNINKALSFLRKIEEDSFIIKYDIKILYLMISFDLNHNDSVLIQINNYRKFLTRNKLVTETRKKKLNIFLNLFERLVYFKEGDPKVKLSDLHYDIQKIKDINHKSWLLNRIKDFK